MKHVCELAISGLEESFKVALMVQSQCFICPLFHTKILVDEARLSEIIVYANFAMAGITE